MQHGVVVILIVLIVAATAATIFTHNVGIAVQDLIRSCSDSAFREDFLASAGLAGLWRLARLFAHLVIGELPQDLPALTVITFVA